MTEILITANDRWRQVTATGGETEIGFDFPLFAKADLVVKRNRAGTITTLVLDTTYTIADDQLDYMEIGRASCRERV